MWMSEELLTREEVDQRLAEDGLKPGNLEYVNALSYRFIYAEMTTPDGKPLYVEIDDRPSMAAVAAQGS